MIKQLANTKDLTVFEAASDVSTTRLLDYKAAKCGYPTLVFDVTSAHMHANKDELVFLEPPEEEVEEYGVCLWQAVKVVYGWRRTTITT